MDWIPKQPPEHILGKESQNPRRIFVDLGSGSYPAVFDGNRKLEEDDYYVGVEQKRTEIDRALSTDTAKNSANLDKLGGNVFFLEHNMNLSKLPFADSSVNEVVMGNILGNDNIILHTFKIFLNEANRILKEDGVLVVFDTVTPGQARYLSNPYGSDNAMLELLEKSGFEVVKEVKYGDSDFETELSKYKQSHVRLKKGNEFIMYFRKK